jgi:glycosyltransferase involved in cell wall biosynthesis
VAAAALVRANNDAGAAFMRRFCAGAQDAAKIRRVYNPFDVAAIVPRPTEPAGPFTLASGGSLVEQKGLDDLLRAVAGLRGRGVECRVRLVGDGPLREALEHQAREDGIADRVEFLGAMPNPDVLRVMREAHAFVLPSRPAANGCMDGIPNVLIEAMALGVPAVSTRLSGIPELIEDGVCGLLVAPGDVAGLAAAIARLHGDAELRARFSTAGRCKVEALFDMTRNARTLVTLYREGGLL